MGWLPTITEKDVPSGFYTFVRLDGPGGEGVMWLLLCAEVLRAESADGAGFLPADRRTRAPPQLREEILF